MAWTCEFLYSTNDELSCKVTFGSNLPLTSGSILPIRSVNSELLKMPNGQPINLAGYDPALDHLWVLCVELNPGIGNSVPNTTFDMNTIKCTTGKECKHPYVVVYRNQKGHSRGAYVAHGVLTPPGGDRTASKVKDTMGGDGSNDIDG